MMSHNVGVIGEGVNLYMTPGHNKLGDVIYEYPLLRLSIGKEVTFTRSFLKLFDKYYNISESNYKKHFYDPCCTAY